MCKCAWVVLQRAALHALFLPLTMTHGSLPGLQTPVVGLVCGFRAPRPSQPTLLSHGEVETLFHEMGHAMHCMRNS
jgi:Zn-dependent oligopeptidase